MRGFGEAALGGERVGLGEQRARRAGFGLSDEVGFVVAARLAAEALSLGLHMAAVVRIGGPMPPVMPLLRTVAAAVLTAAVAFGVTRLVPGAVGILPAVAAGAITYAVAVRMLRLVDADEARLLHDGSGRVLPARFRPLATRLIRLLTGHA